MIELATGLALRRPYESDYNAVRRFLAANARMSSDQIDCRLKKVITKLPRRNLQRPPLSYQRMIEWEKRYCARYSIDFVPPRPILYKASIRNCSECARHCYHSDLYQYPWLVRCPLHRLPLTDNCPSCHQPWPHFSSLRRTSCPTCGTGPFLFDIRARQAFDRIFTPNPFEALAESAHRFNNVDKGYAGSDSESHAHDNGMLFTISDSHPFAPAVMNDLTRSNTWVLEACCDPLTAIAAEPYDLTEMPFVPFTHRERAHMMRNIAASTGERLISTLDRQFGVVPVSRKRWVYEQFRSLEWLIHESFWIWAGIVMDFTPRKRHATSNLLGSDYFRTPCCHSMPLAPDMPSYIRFANEWHCAMLEAPLRLPLSLAVRLYEIDLWHTFLIILHYMDVLSLKIREQRSWSFLYETLPYIAQPDYWEQHSLAILRKTGIQEVELIISDCLHDINFRGIELFMLKNECNNSKPSNKIRDFRVTDKWLMPATDTGGK